MSVTPFTSVVVVVRLWQHRIRKRIAKVLHISNLQLSYFSHFILSYLNFWPQSQYLLKASEVATQLVPKPVLLLVTVFALGAVGTLCASSRAPPWEGGSMTSLTPISLQNSKSTYSIHIHVNGHGSRTQRGGSVGTHLWLPVVHQGGDRSLPSWHTNRWGSNISQWLTYGGPALCLSKRIGGLRSLWLWLGRL